MESERSPLYSQESATGPCSEPGGYSSHTATLFL
jgi:hypothetical protein